MKAIYKYSLCFARKPGDFAPLQCTVEMPHFARVVHAEMTDVGNWTVWVEVAPDLTKVPTTFYVFPTGGEVKTPDTWHVKTAFEGPFVWHLFHKTS